MAPLVRALQESGDEVTLTARDHAQTIELARSEWSDVRVIGGSSPGGRLGKMTALMGRANELRAFARTWRPDVAFSHGSYAQIVAARLAGVPSVTMMDYEHQPANHLSFRLAGHVIVPEAFPGAALRKFGARGKVVRFTGYKEELYLDGFRPDPGTTAKLRLDSAKIVAVLRPPPDGALYHRVVNHRFDELLQLACSRSDVTAVVLPRSPHQAQGYVAAGALVPAHAVDGRSLLAAADLAIGAGGTMNREAALLGTPTYTIFAGRLAAVDAELIREGRMVDLRPPAAVPEFVKKRTRDAVTPADRGSRIRETVLRTLREAAG